MVIESFHTDIANRTMRGTRRSINVASVAIFYFKVVGFDVQRKYFVYESYPGYFFAYGDLSELC
jgi:hypothetical protein